MKKITAILLVLVSFQSHAALVARAGGNAYYDTVLDITWLTDARYAATEDFGIGGITAQGNMTFATSQLWIAELNNSNHLGNNNWRLPTNDPINGVSYVLVPFTEDGSTDRARNLTAVDSAYAGSTASEMANLYFNTLGNISTRDVDSNTTACYDPNVPMTISCLVNTGPFVNMQAVHFWSGSASPNAGEQFSFNFNGYQDVRLDTEIGKVWAVTAGDALVPIPPALVLFPSALAALGWIRRRKSV